MTAKGSYNRKTVNVKQVYSNVEQQVIQITEDKLRLVLNEHISFLETKSSWISPFGILITLIVVFSTTEFKEAYFSPDTWKAVFIITTVITTFWLIKSLYKLTQARSVNDIISKIKNNDI